MFLTGFNAHSWWMRSRSHTFSALPDVGLFGQQENPELSSIATGDIKQSKKLRYSIVSFYIFHLSLFLFISCFLCIIPSPVYPLFLILLLVSATLPLYFLLSLYHTQPCLSPVFILLLVSATLPLYFLLSLYHTQTCLSPFFHATACTSHSSSLFPAISVSYPDLSIPFLSRYCLYQPLFLFISCYLCIIPRPVYPLSFTLLLVPATLPLYFLLSLYHTQTCLSPFFHATACTSHSSSLFPAISVSYPDLSIPFLSRYCLYQPLFLFISCYLCIIPRPVYPLSFTLLLVPATLPLYFLLSLYHTQTCLSPFFHATACTSHSSSLFPAISVSYPALSIPFLSSSCLFRSSVYS